VHVGDTRGQSHLDRLDRMAEITRTWAEEFSFVLVDLPPLLLSADAEILARNLEHLIVVIEANGINAGELRRAGRTLEKLDPAAVGIVVNRVRPFDGGGYLRGMILEYLSARKLSDYHTTSAWALGAQAHWLDFRMRHRRVGRMVDRLHSVFGKWTASRSRRVSRRDTREPSTEACSLSDRPRPETAGHPPARLRPWRKGLRAALILLIASALSYFLIRHPEAWVSMLVDAASDEQPISMRVPPTGRQIDPEPSSPAAGER
jgi:hypothetical protein